MHNFPVDVLSVSMAHKTPRPAFDSIIARTPLFLESPPGELSVYASTYYSLLYVSETEVFPVRVNDTLFSYQDKHLYLFPPFVPHTPTSRWEGKTSSLGIKFLIPNKTLELKFNETATYAPCSDEMFRLLEQIKNITLENPQKPILNELVYKLADLYINSDNRKNIETDEQREINIGFPKLIKYLYKNYERDVTLSDMAGFVHLDKAYFSKKFKSFYNITPMNYLYSLRLTISFDMLIHTNHSISQIAEEVGFKNVSAYCTAFRRAYGVSPTEYRERGKIKQFSKNTNFTL